MPRGIPKAREFGFENTNTQRLIEAMNELQQRIAVERAKDRARALLIGFAHKHNLTAIDLRNAAKILGDRKVGDAPVVALVTRKSSLRPDKSKPAKGKVGKAIRAARIKAGLTDRQIADRVGVHVSAVNAWQMKQKPVREAARGPLIDLLKLPKDLFGPSNANGHAEAG
jgi:hypothetical protein